MTIEIRQLRCAAMTADMQSFSRAAQKLGLKQSTLSKRIMELERRLGVKLFERSTRGAFPTKAAASFLADARRILNDVDGLASAARAIRYGEAGQLKIGFCSSLASGNLHDLLATFLINYPDLELNAIQADPERLRRGLADHDIDVVIVSNDLRGDGILMRPLWPERIMVGFTETHALAKVERIYWTDLSQEAFVLPKGHPSPAFGELMMARLEGQVRTPDIIFQQVSTDTILNMLSIGKFMTLVSESSIGTQRAGLIFRDIYDVTGQSRMDIAAYWRADNQNLALRRFMRLLDELQPVGSLA
jgi:DNA-binding transcriptional LysR family regulator